MNDVGVQLTISSVPLEKPKPRNVQRRMMPAFVTQAAVRALLVALSLAAGCSDAPNDGSRGRGTGATFGGGATPSGGSADASGGGMGANGAPGCGDACAAGTYCSTTGACIIDGTCAANADCSGGRSCVEHSCQLDKDCGGAEFELDAIAPNLLILLDRSCSMPDCLKYGLVGNCFNFSGVDRWAIAVDAIVQLTDRFGDRVQWGLELFPDSDGDACVQSSPIVTPAPGTAGAIQRILTDALVVTDPNFPDGPCKTNIYGSVQQVASEPSLQDPSRENFVLLITDGDEAGCQASNADIEAGIAALAGAGTRTFVVGFGGGFNPQVLDSFAAAGGAPNPDPLLDYYQASDIDSLSAALGTIVGRIVACDFQLQSEPEDTAAIYVWANDTVSIARDDPDGWVYDVAGRRLSFQGAACEAIRSGQYADIDVVFGCDAPVLQ